MAYTKIAPSHFTRVEKLYGADSLEYKAMELLTAARVGFDDIALLVGFNVEEVKQIVLGHETLDAQHRVIVLNCITRLLPIALEKKLLPCKDSAVMREILKVLIEIMHLTRENNALQAKLNMDNAP